MHKLRINPIVIEDLIEIKDYVANELDCPVSATNIVNSIIEKYEKLKKYPHMGADLSSKIGVATDFRYLICGKYIVFYKFDSQYVSIYRILYSKRDYLKVLFDEEI